jgi:hypothetical protein
METTTNEEKARWSTLERITTTNEKKDRCSTLEWMRQLDIDPGEF